MIQKVRKAIIPVAGLGTRFLPATKAQPKEMLPIVDKPAVQYLVEEVVASGITEIIFVTGREKRTIEDHFDIAPGLEHMLEEKGKPELAKLVRDISNLAQFSYVRQKFPRGDGDALLQASRLVHNEPVLVVFGDCLYDSEVPSCKQVIDSYEKFNAPIIGLAEIQRSDVSKFGVIDGDKIDDKHFDIKAFVEKPTMEKAPSNLAVVGKYVVTPAVFDTLRELDKNKSFSGELRLANAFDTMIKRGDRVVGRVLDGTWLDTGDKFNFLKANIHMALKHPEIGPKLRSYINDLK
ncbi:MAG: UTP--glucose-1-phosphate uridylyltransferase [bacterium]|nr:UTP--glucose-1-phosphate uridylyltransferase [bacterium]